MDFPLAEDSLVVHIDRMKFRVFTDSEMFVVQKIANYTEKSSGSNH